MAGQEINGIVREFPASQHTLASAMDYIENRQVTVNRLPVNVFRSVLPQTDIGEIDISAYLQGHEEVVVNKESLERLKDNVYQLISDKKQRKDNRITLSNENGIYVQQKANESDERYAERIFSKLFHEAEIEKYESLYGRDSTIAPNNKTYLQTPSSALNPDKGIPVIEGINTSMWYIGGPGSATVYHVEDGDLASMNVLIKGEVKVWGFISKDRLEVLKQKIKDYMNDEKECTIFHKPGLLINPQLLRKWNIDVDYIVQRPGDLVYVGEATVHFVVNNGLNIAEAINYGTKNCTVEPDITFCSCESVGRYCRQDILPVASKTDKVQKSTKKMYKCQHENCDKIFIYKKFYEKHVFDCHNELPHVCKSVGCKNRYRSRQALHKHEKKCKNLNREHIACSNRKACPYSNCRKFIVSKHMNRHINEQHLKQEKGSCDNCKKEMYKRNLVAHFKKCKGERARRCNR